MGFPKIRDTFLGAPIVKIILYWGLFWGSPNFGKLPHKRAALSIYEGNVCYVGKGPVEELNDNWVGP